MSEIKSDGDHEGLGALTDLRADCTDALYRLVSAPGPVDWAAVVDRAASHPVDAQWFPPDNPGECPLHALVRHADAPPEAVEAVLRADPRWGRDADYESPVHIACRCDAPHHVVRALVDAALAGEDDGDSWPFGRWLVWPDVSAGAVRTLLGCCPPRVLASGDGVQCFAALDDVIAFAAELWGDPGFFDDGSSSEDDVKRMQWEKLKILLAAAESQADADPRPLTRPLIALLRWFARSHLVLSREVYGGLSVLLSFLRRETPEQFREADGDGSLPLHAILSIPGGQWCGDDDRTLVRDVTRILLGAHPRSAAVPDPRQGVGGGALPLHVALRNGWPCHREILRAEPRAIYARDEATGLLPFQVAATSHGHFGCHSREYRLYALDAAYELLRAAPMLAWGLGTSAEKGEGREEQSRRQVPENSELFS